MTSAPASPAVASKPYTDLKKRLKEAAVIDSVRALLSWDQEALMPAKAATLRGEQLAWLARQVHERKTDPAVGDLISACEDDADVMGDPDEAANMREIRRDYEKATKLPSDLVAELTEVTTHSMTVWRDARAKSDFSIFKPWLSKVTALVQKKAECYGAPEGGELYDALIDEYEPGAKGAEIEAVFTPLRERLIDIIARAKASGHTPNERMRKVDLPVEQQEAFNRKLAKALQFDDDAGRLDQSTHPFSEPIGPGDTRMTTRYTRTSFLEGMLATIHETGHSNYEQGLPKETRFGQPLGEAVSLGIHESQSRMRENQVGRSLPFCNWMVREARAFFGAPMDSYSGDDAYSAVNTVKPSFIRVEADETTYPLHVMLRFDAERAIFRGDLSLDDIPQWWNERMKRDLGLDVPDDRRGCLQDVHWSMGIMGYFPTYVLGTLNAAQMWDVLCKDVPGVDGQIEKGDFAPLTAWLRENVHSLGRRYRPGELIERISGRPLSAEPFLNYLQAKVGPLYGI
jgi:carboxypeptidase Taq